MDTIVSLCRGVRGVNGDAGHPYEITVFPIQDYRLIRVELEEAFLENCSAENVRARQQAEYLCGGLFSGKKGSLREKRQELKRRGGWEGIAGNFRRELAALLDERDDNYCLAPREPEGGCEWKTLLPLPVFEGYLEEEWVRRMLRYAIYPNFVLLGGVPYLRELICRLAPRMKNLLWILPDPFYAEQLEDFAEEFYQEFGLAIDMRFPENGGSYDRMYLDGVGLQEPVNILDFTGDGSVPELAPGAGGVWLDMAAVEKKERRIEARRGRVFYFSLKKQWRQPQKWS